MTDDLLSKYTQALADEHDGATAVPEATRARIVRSLADRGPRRNKWLVLGIPLLTVLGGSTAWAAASGQLAPLVERATVALGITPAPSEEPTASEAAGAARTGGEPARPAPPKPSAEPEEVEGDDEPLAEPEHGETASGPSAAQTPRIEANSDQSEEQELIRGFLAGETAWKPGSRPDERQAEAARQQDLLREQAERERERAEAERQRQAAALAAYRSAHDTHFAAGDCSRAERAYADYLRDYPEGSFALEARYNRGVCLVQLGRTSEALTVLRPFAAGAYGDYRRAKAAELIDVLER